MKAHSDVRERREASSRLILLMLGSFLGVYPTVSLNVTLPAFTDIFQTDFLTVQWLVTGFALATGIVVPLSGFLGDRFSYRNLFLVCVAGIAVTSLLCALAWNMASLIVFRVLQGLCCGLIQPVALTLLYRWTRAAEQSKALSLWSASTVAATAIAPTLSGAMQDVHWSLMFVITVPPAIAVFALSLRLTSREPDGGAERPLDRTGLLLAVAGSLALLLAAGNVARWGWLSAGTICLLSGGLLLLACFVRRSLRSRSPLLELRLFRYRVFTASVALTVILMIGLYAGAYFLPIYLQAVHGLTAMHIGLLFLPAALCLTGATLLTGPGYERLGPVKLVAIGAAIIIGSTMALAKLHPDTSLMYVLFWMCLRNVGIGLSLTPITNAGMKAVPDAMKGHASSLLHWIRQVTSAIGIGLLTSFFVQQMSRHTAQIAEREQYTMAISATLWVTIIIMAAVLPMIPYLFQTKKISEESVGIDERRSSGFY